MTDFYAGRLLVVVPSIDKVDDAIDFLREQAPDGFHAVLVDPLISEGSAIVVDPNVEPDYLHELIFGPTQRSDP